MNFLAHSLLTPDSDAWLTGNIAADLIKKRDIHLLDEDVRRGIFLHYEIDTFTDNSPNVAEGTRLLHPTQGKYSPVGTDLIWDLCLAQQWTTFTEVTLTDHINHVYRHLLETVDELETKLAERIKYLIDKDFLTQYTKAESMRTICEKIDKRTRFKSNLVHLIEDYMSLEQQFNDLFQTYFPQLSSKIDGWKNNILSNQNSNESA